MQPIGAARNSVIMLLVFGWLAGCRTGGPPPMTASERAATDWVNCGHRAHAQKDYANAVKYFTKSMEAGPPAGCMGAIHYFRGMSYLCMTNSALAMLDFNRAIEMEKKASSLAQDYNGRGLTFGQMSNHVAAIADLTKAIELRPDSPVYYFNRGTQHEMTGAFEAALADYRKALSFPSLPDVMRKQALELVARMEKKMKESAAPKPDT
jgi:tetratricopeptide (TPR) repeat protein